MPLAAVVAFRPGYRVAPVAGLRRDGATLAFPEEAVERLFGLAFGFEQIGRNLGELAGRVGELTELAFIGGSRACR